MQAGRQQPLSEEKEETRGEEGILQNTGNEGKEEVWRYKKDTFCFVTLGVQTERAQPLKTVVPICAW